MAEHLDLTRGHRLILHVDDPDLRLAIDGLHRSGRQLRTRLDGGGEGDADCRTETKRGRRIGQGQARTSGTG